MKREIEFRAKAVTDHKWRYGYLTECDEFCLIDQRNECLIDREYNFRGDTHWFEIAVAMCDKNTIGQYTGLKDKNGKKIYEGDIVIFSDCVGDCKCHTSRYEVHYDEQLAAFLPMIQYSHCVEVIGNIYDNPELMNIK